MPESQFTHENRPLKLETPLGPDVLLIKSIEGTEGLSQIYSYRIEMAWRWGSEDGHIFQRPNLQELIGKMVLVTVVQRDNSFRYISGVVRKLTRVRRDHDWFEWYTAEIVPPHWALSKRIRTRLFQYKTTPEILRAVLQGTPHEIRFVSQYEPYEYRTQYHESDLDFLSRLMEDEGIYYYFRHDSGGPVMILVDDKSSHRELPVMPQLKYEPLAGGRRDEERIQRWYLHHQVELSKYVTWDHNFELPSRHLEAESAPLSTVEVGAEQYKLRHDLMNGSERYEFPGGYAHLFDGVGATGGDTAAELQKIFTDNTRRARVRMDQEQLSAIVAQAQSNYPNIAAGYKFTLTNHHSEGGQFIITTVRLRVNQMGWFVSTGSQPDFCVNDFECIPVNQVFRPRRATPRPRALGPHTAVVVGPQNEQVFVDQYGRVKVQFYWDREGQLDQNSSCWLRVAHPWGGKKWGFFSIPRIGAEVVVEFEYGDPDRPLITGSVYNADNMQPYQLPEHKFRSTWKTQSARQGVFHELRFEDKADHEQIYLHSGKDLDIRVVNDRREFAGQDYHREVTRHQFTKVGENQHSEVGGEVREKIGGALHLKVSGEERHEIGGNLGLKISGSSSTEVMGATSLTTNTSLYLKGGSVVVEGTMDLTVKCGANFINIGPAGIFIQGTMVYLNSGGMAGIGMAGMIQAPSAPESPAAVDEDQAGQLLGPSAAS